MKTVLQRTAKITTMVKERGKRKLAMMMSRLRTLGCLLLLLNRFVWRKSGKIFYLRLTEEQPPNQRENESLQL